MCCCKGNGCDNLQDFVCTFSFNTLGPAYNEQFGTQKCAHSSRVLGITELFTGRNEVVAKVMFLHVCVILFTGGGLQAGRTPRQEGGPPRTRQTTPGRNPPRTRQTPPGKQTPEYGLRAASTHPTGMHSC